MSVRDHILTALDALQRRDLPGVRRAIGDARHIAGHWRAIQLRSSDAVAVSILAASARETVAVNLANAADAVSPPRDTWPDDVPYHVAEWLDGLDDPRDDVPASVEAWLREHDVIAVPIARVSLQSALDLLPHD